MEMPVILFDMDSKLAASRLSQELLSRLASVQEEPAATRVLQGGSESDYGVPTDRSHSPVPPAAFHSHGSESWEWAGRVSRSQTASPRDRIPLFHHLRHFEQ